MKTELLSSNHPIAYLHTVDVLKHGGLIGIPTDTVYGLASLPFDEKVVERLFAAKGRNSARAIAVLVGKTSDLEKVTLEMSGTAQKLAEKFWPGPLTLVVKKHPRLPAALSQNNTIGVRIPNHPVALKLLLDIGPLAVTSANLSGMDNTNTAEEVMGQLKGRIHLILDGGRTPGGVPSTVVDCTQPQLVILRPGPLSLEELEAVL